tara:strand:+ start:460 stop:588 length:129 start_codon:yes stop_codon:yes gene_type:complete
MAWSLISYKKNSAEKNLFDLKENEGPVTGSGEKEINEDPGFD